jgi:hypothetical protein
MYDEELIVIRERLEIGTLDDDSPYLYEIYSLTDIGAGIVYRIRIWHKKAELNPLGLNPFGDEEIKPILQETYLTLKAAQRAKETLIAYLTDLERRSKLHHEQP